MVKKVTEYLKENFSFLINEKNFKLVKFEYDADKFQYLEALYESNIMLIKIVKYRHELYVHLAPLNFPDDWADLFMIIEYINKNNRESISSEFFHEEKNLLECYKKQIDWNSSNLYEYLNKIKLIYSENNYKREIKKINKFADKRAMNFFRK